MDNANDQRRRIVFHSENGPIVGGSDFYLGRLMDGLDPEQWKIFLLARPGYPLQRITTYPERVTHVIHGPPLREIPIEDRTAQHFAERPSDLPCQPRMVSRLWSRAPRSIRRDVGLMRDANRVARLLTPIAPDVMHSVDGGPQPAVIGAARTGVKIVLGYSAPPPLERHQGICRRIERRAFEVASVRLTKSQFAKRDWADYLDCEERLFDVIPNGIDVGRFESIDPLESKRALGIPEDKTIIGMTARLEKEKGVEAFVDAAKILAQSSRDLIFIIAGDGTLAKPLERSVHSAKLTDRIRFLGERTDIATVTAAYDIAVVPSIWNEPFGWVVLEAMAARKPVIASRVGGIPEIVLDRETGILTNPNAIGELIAAIHLLSQNASMRTRMGEHGLRRVKQAFSSNQMLNRTLAIYDKLCGTPLRTPSAILPLSGAITPCGQR